MKISLFISFFSESTIKNMLAIEFRKNGFTLGKTFLNDIKLLWLFPKCEKIVLKYCFRLYSHKILQANVIFAAYLEQMSRF